MPDAIPEPDEAVRDLLGLRLVATLGTTNDDGSIHLVPLWYLYEAGRLYLPTGSAQPQGPQRASPARPSPCW